MTTIIATPAIAPVPTPIPAPTLASTSVATPTKEKEKPKRFGSRMIALPRREAFVQWIVNGGRYGHHDLFPIRFTQHELTHEAYSKLTVELAKKKVVLAPGKLGYVESQCFFVPATLKPVDEKKSGKGESGVLAFRYSSVNVRPGSYMLIAVAEAIVFYFASQLTETMKIRVDPAKGAHTLSCDDISLFLSTTQDPVLAHLRLFYERWKKNVTFTEVKKLDKKTQKTVISRLYHPLGFVVPNAKLRMSDNQRHIIDQIAETRQAAMKKRGEELYAKALAKGSLRKFAIVEKKEEVKKEGEKKKGRQGVVRTEFTVAVDADRKGAKEEKHLSPEDDGYDPSSLLSQGSFAKDIFLSIPDAKLYIGKLRPEAKRFFDDMFNELLFSLVGIAITKMHLVESLKMTPRIVGCTIKDFFDALCGTEPSNARTLSISRADEIEKEYEAAMARKHTKNEEAKKRRLAAGETASAIAADEEIGDDLGEEEGDDEETQADTK